MSEAATNPLRASVCVGCRFAQPAAPAQAEAYVICGWTVENKPYWLPWYVTQAARTRALREWTGRPQIPCAVREPVAA